MLHTVSYAQIDWQHPNGDIISYTDVGPGAGSDPPRPWVCYTSGDTSNVVWQRPDGTIIATGANPAPDNDVATRTNSIGLSGRAEKNWHC